MKISARNILKGKVTQMKPGAVNTEVVIELPGGQQVVSIITKASAESLGTGGGQGGLRRSQGLKRDDRGGLAFTAGGERAVRESPRASEHVDGIGVEGDPDILTRG